MARLCASSFSGHAVGAHGHAKTRPEQRLKVGRRLEAAELAYAVYRRRRLAQHILYTLKLFLLDTLQHRLAGDCTEVALQQPDRYAEGRCNVRNVYAVRCVLAYELPCG